ncbi:3-deoxy-D-manno-octulosonic acid transferase [Flavobacterium ammoniigenes]|jgi:3-deoxy-D-manno-octulosonic-acid transferase|uniref:3-deoxy-D-manno-octulosonic acid transferase n=1 Tax=Flavobacterium ammoniigenes TaxID=1751095 RepID=A0ABM7V2Z6_9FLAO|nr:glycosyltransferase N-terminal domain-containing protein [Flavobacterium ammoniigenes]BDB53887.1 3-deoxy-D-manno-octulosonic acid transferase [Flavobacterium ammoniigenes]
MHFIYSIIVAIAGLLLQIVAVFVPKIKLFVSGREGVFPTLKAKIKTEDKTIWFHAASLGEYEQGLPVIEKIKEKYPTHKIIVSFFSPSGYEVRKNNTVADVTVYLPLDTINNAKKFIELVHPEMAFFIKYEFWPNYLSELKKRNIPTYLISGIFREKQAFFRWYGGFYRKALESFTHFFVQNESSLQLLQRLGIQNATISGDTRFDRVASIVEKNNSLDYIGRFKANKTTIVIGSSWPKDEELLLDYINSSTQDCKFIIAPHNIKPEQIQYFKSNCTKKTLLFSEKENKDMANYDVFIIDTIGILTKIYSYADIAYVGGGFGHPGVHNILEPATFGIPIVIGPNYSHFAEAIDLVRLGGCISIKNSEQLNAILNELIVDSESRKCKGSISTNFVQNNAGAVARIMKKI